jgi:hypothetical protein
MEILELPSCLSVLESLLNNFLVYGHPHWQGEPLEFTDKAGK